VVRGQEKNCQNLPEQETGTNWNPLHSTCLKKGSQAIMHRRYENRYPAPAIFLLFIGLNRFLADGVAFFSSLFYGVESHVNGAESVL
jgi:hypothetical protein